MPPTLTLDELATELGRTSKWLYANWQTMVRTERMPRPLHMAPPYVWSTAQIFAWLDRNLTPAQRAAAAAYRAAATAAADATGHPSRSEAVAIAAHQQRLNARFVRS